jgi:hypothetical protein
MSSCNVRAWGRRASASGEGAVDRRELNSNVTFMITCTLVCWAQRPSGRICMCTRDPDFFGAWLF